MSQDGNGDHTSIQDAIDAAGSGDTIRVWEGTYTENVVVDKRMDLVGNGSGETTIDGERISDVVRITADRVNISGFRMINARMAWPEYCAGIRVPTLG